MFALWRICGKVVDYFDREWNEDKRSKREIPLLLVVGLLVVAGIGVSMLVGYLSTGNFEGLQPMP